MPYFKITLSKGGQAVGTVKADDATTALDVFALKSGFWDFRDLASLMDLTEEKARAGLVVRETTAPTKSAAKPRAVPEFVVP